MGRLVNLNEIEKYKTTIFSGKIYDWIRNGYFSSVLHLLGLDGTRNDRGKGKKYKRQNCIYKYLVNNLMNKDSEKISLILDFLAKHCRAERIRSLLGGGKNVFYLIPCKEFENKSLLQYIDAQGIRMVRQKEELIDLAIKIQRINREGKIINSEINQFKREIMKFEIYDHGEEIINQLGSQPVADLIKKYVEGFINGKDEENEKEFADGMQSATDIDINGSNYRCALSDLRKGLLSVSTSDDNEVKDEVIASFKADLPASVGLRDSIDMISQRFSWTRGKMVIMIIISCLTNIFGIVFYAFDFCSDFMFSVDMLKGPKKNSNCSQLFSDFRDNLTEIKTFSEFTNFFASTKIQRDEGRKCENSISFTDDTIFGVITMIHCFIPFLFIILVFCRMILKEDKKNFWGIPLPIITNLHNIYLEYKCHCARAKRDFKEKIAPIENKIKDHEKSVVLALVIEASTEATFQFFIQTLYLMPTLVTDTTSMRLITF